MPFSPEFPALSRWFKNPPGATQVTRGDSVGAQLCLSEATGDDGLQARLRCTARAMADGTDLSRLDEQQLLDLLSPWLADGWLHLGSAKPAAYQLVPVAAPAAAAAAGSPAPAPASAPRPAAASPAPAPTPADSTFAPNLDIEAMVAVLRAAAQQGVPFCEECARAAVQQQVAEASTA